MAEEMVEQRVKILMAHQPPSKRPRQDKMMDDEDEWVSSMLLHAEQVKVKVSPHIWRFKIFRQCAVRTALLENCVHLLGFNNSPNIRFYSVCHEVIHQ